jgi:hypothetical protein
MDGVVVTIPGFQGITQIVRILPPPGTWISVRGGIANPQCFGDSHAPKTTRFAAFPPVVSAVRQSRQER